MATTESGYGNMPGYGWTGRIIGTTGAGRKAAEPERADFFRKASEALPAGICTGHVSNLFSANIVRISKPGLKTLKIRP